MMTIKTDYIKGLSSENTGGGCMVDFVHLWDGRVLGINGECVCLYPNYEAFWDARPNVPTIDLLTSDLSD